MMRPLNEWEEDGREVATRVVAQDPHEPANPTSNARRGTLPFRMTTGTGDAAAASCLPTRELSVWIFPSSHGQILLLGVSDEAVSSVYIELPSIAGGTNDASKERMCRSDLNSL